jgi:hypothetical protein
MRNRFRLGCHAAWKHEELNGMHAGWDQAMAGAAWYVSGPAWVSGHPRMCWPGVRQGNLNPKESGSQHDNRYQT